MCSFTRDPGIKALVETSLLTKTVDYLASGRPVLIVSPSYSAEVDCFKDVSLVVDELDENKLVAAIRRLADDALYTAELREKGLAMVESQHSMQALYDNFLWHFELPGAGVPDTPPEGS
jgi:hypothetical protein